MINYRDRIVAREWAEEVLLREPTHTLEEVTTAEVILEVVKAPTLDDMSDKELEGCTFMQALDSFGERVVILHTEKGTLATVLKSDGYLLNFAPEKVTPLFHLPRLEWPSGIVGGER